MKQRFKLNKGGRGINACAISPDNKYVAFADLHNDHNVYVYEIESGSLVMKDKGSTGKIFDCAFSHETGEGMTLVTVGVKHIKFWYPL